MFAVFLAKGDTLFQRFRFEYQYKDPIPIPVLCHRKLISCNPHCKEERREEEPKSCFPNAEILVLCNTPKFGIDLIPILIQILLA